MVGDAAACISLLGGEGTGLAITEAYVLAGELERHGGDHAAAFANFEQRLEAIPPTKTDIGLKIRIVFRAQNKARARIPRFSNKVAAATPFIADYFVGRDLNDKIDLPDYVNS